jgi:hypothetical protein
MIRSIQLECGDPKRMELLLKVAKEMGIEILSDDEVVNTVQEPILTYEQKLILDERRSTTNEEEFIPWDEAKKQLKFGNK